MCREKNGLQTSLLLAWSVALCVAAWGCAKAPLKGLPKGGEGTQVVLKIKGMTCQGCVQRVQQVLAGTRGVYRCKVSLKPPLAHVRYDAKATNPQELLERVKGAGPYRARVHTAARRLTPPKPRRAPEKKG